MTPADETRFIQLWNAGTETAGIARRLGLEVTTAHPGLGVHRLRGCPAYVGLEAPVVAGFQHLP